MTDKNHTSDQCPNCGISSGTPYCGVKYLCENPDCEKEVFRSTRTDLPETLPTAASDELVRAVAVASLGAWFVLVEKVVTEPPCNPFAAHCSVTPFPELELLIAVLVGAVFLSVFYSGRLVYRAVR